MRITPSSSVLILLLFTTLPAIAQSPPAEDRIRQLELQLQQQREINERQQAVLEQMQQELERLKTGPAATAGTTEREEELMKIAEEDNAPVQNWVRSPSMDISGYVDLDMIYDFDRVAPDYEATLVPTTIPTVPGEYGSDGNLIVSVKQSRLSFLSQAETPLGDALAWIEFDLFGTGSNAGKTTFNLRQAWFELGNWGAGQTWSTFTDISTWPNIYDWWGPSGMAINRNPMLSYTVPYGDRGSNFAVALEKQNGSFNVGIIDQIAPTLAADLTPKSELPDLVTHWRTEQDWGHFQIAGVARKLSWETLKTPDNRPGGSTFGWGFNLTGVINTVGRDQIKYGLTFGKGIATFMNDGGGSNLAPVFTGTTIEVEPMKSWGYMVYYDHYWSEHWSSAIGISQNDNKLTNLQLTSEPDKVTYASTNLFYTPSSSFLIGVEALYGKLETADGSSGTDFRLQFTTRYSFANRYTSR